MQTQKKPAKIQNLYDSTTSIAQSIFYEQRKKCNYIHLLLSNRTMAEVLRPAPNLSEFHHPTNKFRFWLANGYIALYIYIYTVELLRSSGAPTDAFTFLSILVLIRFICIKRIYIYIHTHCCWRDSRFVAHHSLAYTHIDSFQLFFY